MFNRVEDTERNTPIWSWLIWVYSSVKSWILWLCSWFTNNTSNSGQRAATSRQQNLVVHQPVNLELIKELPTNVFQYMTNFLPLFPRVIMPSIPNAFSTSRSYQLDMRKAKFSYFVAIEGEDNQNQAEAMLSQYGDLTSKLISEQRDISDAAGRQFIQPMSAYSYAFWAADTRMCRMMERFMDEDTKPRILEQCKNIEQNGVDFTLNGELIKHSKYFDFRTIIDAYNAYIASATLLINANNGDGEWSDEAWAPADILWLNVAKELAKVPTHVAQEYCSNIPFFPLSNFKASLDSPALARTVKFYNQISHQLESWFIRGVVNLNLGPFFSIYKSGGRAFASEGAVWGFA